MISGINADDANLMQLLFSASRGLSGVGANNNIGEASKVSDEGENGFLKCLNENFSKLDANSDSVLSKDEIKSFMKDHKPMGPPPGLEIEHLNPSDVNKAEAFEKISGKREKNEADFTSALDDFISTLDTNKDGKLSVEELGNASEKSDKAERENSKTRTNALAEVWDKLSDSDITKKLVDQFSRKISEAYKSSMSSGTLSSLTNLVT